MENIDFSLITPCGENCSGCEKKRTGICQGCIESGGLCKEWEGSGGCPIFKCAVEHEVKFCGLCNEFPCDFLVNKVVWNPNIVEEHNELVSKYNRRKKY